MNPTQRLERRKQLAACRVCAWLSSLEDKRRKEWQDAIFNPKFGAGSIAQEIMVDARASDYEGEPIGESSVQSHRNGMHR